MSINTLNRNTYLSKNIGDFPEIFQIGERAYVKVEDLRYGTNPHQPAAFYKPADTSCVIGDMVIMKNGKSGLSQTNLEDISHALNIVKFFTQPACAVMKHVNPSGAAVKRDNEKLKQIYVKARDADARAAFGSVIAFNTTVDEETAREIMSTFAECVVAPDYAPGTMAIFNDPNYKFNRHIRIIKCGAPSQLPKYLEDESSHCRTCKVLADGSLVVAAPLLTSLKNINDIRPATGENSRTGTQQSKIPASRQQLEDLLFSWYVNLNVRSNGVVIARNGQTLAVGTGEQDRVGAVEQAIAKYREKYQGNNSIEGAVMASDGFFPFPDAVEVAATAGIKAILAPAGSLRDADVIKRANELGLALLHAPERIFSHH